MTPVADRLARVRLSAGALQALVLACLLTALLSLGIALVTFQRQATVAQREAQAAIEQAVKANQANQVRTCQFVRAFVPLPGESTPGSDYGQRVAASARVLADAAGCP